MSDQYAEVDDFLMGAGGARSAKFENIGDYVTGTILSLERLQQTDIATNEPLWWDDKQTQPKEQVRVILQTAVIEDEEDDGRRAVYIRAPRRRTRARLTTQCVTPFLRRAQSVSRSAAG